MARYWVDDATAAFRSLPPEEQERVARLLAGEQAGGEGEDVGKRRRRRDTWLWRELDARRWSARELGRQIGVSYTHAARLANEEQPLTPEMCKRVANVLEMTEEDVLRQAGHLSPLPNGYSELDEQRLVELYRALGQRERDQLMKFAEFLQKP